MPVKRSYCRWLYVPVLLFLLFSLPRLVEGPEAAPVVPFEELPAAGTVLLPADAAQTAPVHSVQGAPLRRIALLPRRQAPVPQPVKDKNGVPLTAKTYLEAVYTVWRMEACAG